MGSFGLGPNPSPGVYTLETDDSFYQNGDSLSSVGMVGTAVKGPVNQPLLITSPDELVRNFGAVNSNSYGMLAAIKYLKYGNSLYYCRVGSTDVANTKRLAYAKVAVPSATPGTNSFNILAATPGEWGNVLAVAITNAAWATFDLTVSENGVVVETFKGLSTSSVSDSYFEKVLGTVTSETNFKTSAGSSKYIRAVQVTADTLPAVTGTSPLALAGGNSGFAAKVEDYIGFSAIGRDDGLRTGIYTFENPDEFDIDVLSVPGIGDYDYAKSGTPPTYGSQKMLDLCKDRGNVWALIDAPSNMLPADVRDWADLLDSSWGACIWPWVYYYDDNGDLIKLPPAGGFLARVAYTDRVAFNWSAVAGLDRGRLDDAVDVEYNTTQAERDVLYGPEYAINCLCNFRAQGVVIWGNRTLQSDSTALDRLNVRRMMNQLRKYLSKVILRLVFEPNDKATWETFKGLVTPYLEHVKANRGLYDYQIQMDATTVTSEAIDKNIMPGRIFLKPTKTAEVIVVNFTLVPTGVQFSE